jgi:Complex I intermediate-associated protein 30 (CIA30)
MRTLLHPEVLALFPCRCAVRQAPPSLTVEHVLTLTDSRSDDTLQEGGGFCGQRTESRDLDLGSYEGIRLRVRGNGQTFKLNLKTVIVSAGNARRHAFPVMSAAHAISLHMHAAAGGVQRTLFVCVDL